jgi:hypothetical protein
MPQPQES